MAQYQGGTEETINACQPTQEELQQGIFRKTSEEREPKSVSNELTDLIDRIIIIVGTFIFGLSGLALVGFQIYWYHHWWGNLGLLAGVCLTWLSVVFSFVFLVKEEFSLLYFGIWLAGIVGLFGVIVGARMFQPDPDQPPGNSMKHSIY